MSKNTGTVTSKSTCKSDLVFDYQPVMSRAHIVRSFLVDPVVIEINVHVCKVGLAWSNSPNPLQRLLQVDMARVWPSSQGVNNPAVDSLKRLPGRVVQIGYVRQIRKVSNSQSDAVGVPMLHWEYSDVDGAARSGDVHRILEKMEVQYWRVGTSSLLSERISKSLLQGCSGGLVCPDRNPRSAIVVDHSQIVQPVDVVCVAVSVDHGIQMPNVRVK